MGTTKAQIEVDFDLNENIRTDVAKKRKFENSEVTKERHVGIMVENHCKLLAILEKKKISFDELLTNLKQK